MLAFCLATQLYTCPTVMIEIANQKLGVGSRKTEGSTSLAITGTCPLCCTSALSTVMNNENIYILV